MRRRRKALATQQLRTERLLERLPLAVLLFAPSGMVSANPAGTRLFPDARPGATPEQVLAHATLVNAVREVRDSGRTIELRVSRGEQDLLVRGVLTADGEVALVVTDVTESSRLERIRRDFVTNASHELKTPVAGITALAELLEEAVDRDPDRARRMIHRLRDEAERMTKLVRDLLDLARLEEEGAQRASRVDLAAIARAQAKACAVLAAQHEVKVTVECPPEVWLVAVPDDLRLIVANLVENAVRYNRPGGTVTVTVGRHGGVVALEVTDTGLGIPEQDQARVFERFYRVDRSRSRAEGGTGLGLSIVRHAVDQHGGQLALSSVPGEGSTFRVVLPVEGQAS